MIWRKDLILWRFTVVIWVQLWSILCQTGLSCHARKKLKQTNASAHLVQCRFKICGGSPEGIRMTGWKDLWKRERQRCLEWKAEGVTDGENEGDWWLWWGDMRRMRWTRSHPTYTDNLRRPVFCRCWPTSVELFAKRIKTIWQSRTV